MMRHLISLGSRCDVGFQLRMHAEENVAHFFDWLATPTEAVIAIFEADFDVFHPDHLELVTNSTQHYVRDRVTGVLFHHQFPSLKDNVSPDFLLNYDSFIKKFQYLAARLRDYLAARPVTLVRREITQSQAFRLEAAVLSRYPAADVQFLYVNKNGDEFTTPRGYCRRLPHEGESLGNPVVWSEFLLREGLIKTPYRRATIEILGSHDDDYNLTASDRFTEAQLRGAAAANPEHVPYILELSQWYEAKSRYDEAAEWALLALIKAPNDPAVIAQSALMKRRIGAFTPEMTAEALLGALNRVPAGKPNPTLLLHASRALSEAGRFDEALALINQAARLESLQFRHHWQKANCLYRLGDFAKAEYAVEATLRLARPNGTHHILHARILHALGRRDAALQAAKLSLGLAPGLNAWLNLADVLTEIGDGEGAISAYHAALPLSGKDEGTVRKRLASAEARFGFASAAE